MPSSRTAADPLPDAVDAVFIGAPPPGRWELSATARELADQVERLCQRVPRRRGFTCIIFERRPRSEALAAAVLDELHRRGVRAALRPARCRPVAAVLLAGPRGAERLARRAAFSCRGRGTWFAACRAIGKTLKVQDATVAAIDVCRCLPDALAAAGARVAAKPWAGWASEEDEYGAESHPNRLAR